MHQIISLHKLSPQQLKTIQEIAPGYTVTVGKSKDLDPVLLRKAEILIGWSKVIEQDVLRVDSPLKWIQSWSAGVDKMPLDQFSEQGILLTTSSGVHAVPISESIFAMILAFSRGIQQSILNQQANQWDSKVGPDGSPTLTELRGKTIVIVGVGEIGGETARIAKAFGMNVLGVRRSGKSDPHVDTMYTMESLHEALQQSDYIIDILPLTKETYHMFDETAFISVKPGACFINVGRGPTVSTDALLEALEKGIIRYAGLDVFEEEPLPIDHPLWSMKQVIITSHISGSTEHYDERVIDIFIDNLKAYIEGKDLPRNLVNYNLKY
ncbi:D-2-hydroxyacid dehydrogenase [Paenibacillus glacialis]|uniref:Hydroxyacid dehydrogenase n=1 Tax=Paenibacillus glacialis TaxID=494026 RepID=A0A168P0L3_9BACL|nr:D-2-hydroxyacid dehydrogenase [Paenibacillus glacialis]OAB46271.1 hydroxyacid dehydrogenase [Paenibacillus glacialis]